MKNPKILITSWHPGSANSILPVIKQLKRENRVHVVPICHEFSEKIFRKEKVDYRTISDYGLPDVSRNSMEKLLEEESPELIFTGITSQNEENKSVIDQQIILAGRKKKIPTLTFLDWWESMDKFDDNYTNEPKKFMPNKIAIIDKYAKENLLKEGFDGKKLIITGNPSFDKLIAMKEEFTDQNRQKVREDLGIGLDAYIFLFASQPIEGTLGYKYGFTEKESLHGFLFSLEELENKKEFSVLVKVHPRENQLDIEERTKGFDFPIKVDKEYNTLQTVLASDSVVSPFSTVLIESSYLDRPSISFQPGLIGEDTLITNSLDVTVPVYKEKDLLPVLDKVMHDNNYQAELAKKRKDFKTDGKATERVTNLIYDMLGIN